MSRRIILRRAAVAAGALCGLALLLVLIAGWVLTKSARHSIGQPPPGLTVESVSLPDGHDGQIRGWLVPGRTGSGAVLLLHGVRSDRRQMIERARFLHRAGYTSLLIDLPAHGESSGDRISFGVRESVGVRVALAYLRQRCPGEPVAVIGVSLGAVSFVLSHASPAPDAVVLESMYPSIGTAAENRLAIRLGPAGRSLASLLLWQLPLQIGVSPAQLQPISDIRQLRAPVLIISGTLDRHTSLADTRRLFAAANAPKQLWEVRGAAHVDLERFAPDEYERRIIAFLRQNM